MWRHYHRWYLLTFLIVGVPVLLWLETSRDYPEGYVDTGVGTTAQVAAPTPSPLPQPIPSPLPVAAPLPEGPALPVFQPVEQAVVEPTPSELIPINDETAAALGAIPAPAAPMPTAIVLPVTWPVPSSPTMSPLQEFAANAQTTLAEQGYKALPITPVIPRNLVGP